MKLSKILRNKNKAFTLAEVVIVMGILGVMMAAFAPVVTKKTLAVGANSFRNFGPTNGYVGMTYGTVGDSKTVVIGDTEITTGENKNPKLLIMANTTNDPRHIRFGEYNGTDRSYTGELTINSGTILLGGPDTLNASGNNEIFGTFSNSTILGMDACKGNTALSGYSNVICLGKNSGAPSGMSYAGNTIYMGDKTTSYTGSNIYFGTQTLDSLAGGTTCTKSDGTVVSGSICLGEGAGGTNPSNNAIYIGDRGRFYSPDTSIYIGSYTFTQLVNNALADSDIRLKNVGKEFTGGLDEINQLTFYNYTYKRDAEKEPKVGVMAQDLQKVFPNAVKENKDGYLYIRKDDMFYAALNAIKELGKMFTTNDEKIKALEERNAMLEKQNKELQELYIDLSKRIDKLDKKSTKKKLTITPTKVDEETDETTVNTDIEDSNN